jgi:hypothetical protein
MLEETIFTYLVTFLNTYELPRTCPTSAGSIQGDRNVDQTLVLESDARQSDIHNRANCNSHYRGHDRIHLATNG